MRTTFDFKTILLFAFLLSLTTQSMVLGQNKQDDWMIYSIPNVVSFKVPPTMEVRSGESFQAQFVKSFHQSSFFELLCDECDLFFDEAKLVLQPLGLNSSPDSEEFRIANNTYGRIIFNFSYNDLLSQEEIKELTPSDLTILDTLWRNEVRDVLNCVEDAGGNLLGVKDGSFKWYPIKKKHISGLWALVTEYDRPGTGAETHVLEYKFFFEGKLMLITMSYNKKHESKYKDDFKTFIQYLKVETANTIQKQQTSKGLFSSKEYHVRFSYDSNKFAEAKKVNKNSHCFCKLESVNGTQILLSVWDCDYSTEDYSIYDEDIMYDMKQKDKQNKLYDKVLTSCKKVNIGNVKALMSVMSSIVPGINTEYIITSYRAFYKDRFYTFDFYIPVTEYNKNKNVVNELIKGLQFN